MFWAKLRDDQLQYYDLSPDFFYLYLELEPQDWQGFRDDKEAWSARKKATEGAMVKDLKDKFATIKGYATGKGLIKSSNPSLRAVVPYQVFKDKFTKIATVIPVETKSGYVEKVLFKDTVTLVKEYGKPKQPGIKSKGMLAWKEKAQPAIEALIEKSYSLDKFPVVDGHYENARGWEIDEVQTQAINFSLSRKKCGLFLATGVGKTVVSLLAAKYSGAKKILIVCEKKAKGYWQEECEIEGIDADVHHFQEMVKATSQKKDARNQKTFTYYPDNSLGFDITKYDMVIVDESHILANPTQNTNALLAVMKEYKGEYILSLTATPYRNKLTDYHFQLSLIKHPLGKISRAQFETLFEIDDYCQPQADYLAKLTDAVFLTKSKEDAGILIDYEIENILIPQSESFRQKINEKLEKARTMYVQVNGRTTAVNTAMQDLRITCAEEKLTWLKHELRLDPDTKTVVMSNFNQAVLDPLGEYLEQEVYKASMKDKFEHVKAFEQGEFNTFLAQRAIGATSLNVQTASKLILADLHYSLDFFIQAIGRVVRRGQKNKVRILIPLMEDSIELKILNIIQRKHDQYISTLKTKKGVQGQIAFGEINSETSREIRQEVEAILRAKR